jgi:tetratricopeptide (TPR) repeat protein
MTEPAPVVHATLRVSKERLSFDGCGRTASAQVPSDRHRLADALWQLAELRRGRAVLYPPDRTVREAGLALGAVYAGGAVAQAFADVMREASGRGRRLRVALVADDDELHALPWESIVVPGTDLPLVLQPDVELYRRVGGAGPAGASSPRAPLRILALLARPDDGDRALDMEDEQRRIVEALEPAQRSGRAWLRFPGSGTVATIRRSLREHRFHVLHLACHAAPGRLALEAEDGSAEQVRAEELVSAMSGGHLPAVVLLSGCSTAAAPDPAAMADSGAHLQGIAHALVAAGVAQVIAMTSAVTDLYARRLGGLLYQELAAADQPDVLSALSHARRAIERDSAAASAGPAEWPVPALFARGDPEPLFHPADGADELARPAEVTVPGVDVRGVGDLVGRRADRRLLAAALRDPDASGVVIHGIGGAGKSVLAVELLRHEPVPGAATAFVTGAVTPSAILGAVADAIAPPDPTRPVPPLVPALRDPAATWQSGLRALRSQFLDTEPLILLFDNAESNLTLGPDGAAQFADPELGEFLTAWIGDPGRGRLLVTSRHPLPLGGDAGSRMTHHHLGALSYAEALQLMWRLGGLNRLPLPVKHNAYERVGGHPRALEYLDALLRSGRARYADIEERIASLLRERGIDDPAAWQRQVGGRGFSAAAAETIALAAGDSLLGFLLGLLTPRELAALVKAAVFTTRESALALSWQDEKIGDGTVYALMEWLLSGDFEAGALPPQCSRAEDPQFLDDLAGLTRHGLLTSIDVSETVPRALREWGVREPTPELPPYLAQQYLVHRWTAASIAQLYPEQTRAAHREAAQFFAYSFVSTKRNLLAHVGEDRRLPLLREASASLELARRHFREAGDRDAAVLMVYLMRKELVTQGMWDLVDVVSRQTLASVTGVATDRDRWEAVACHLRLGQTQQLRGELPSAEEHCAEAITLIEGGPDKRQLGSALHLLGSIELERGNRAAAREQFRRSIALDAGEEERTGAIARYDLANLELDDGHTELAEGLLREAHAAFQAAGDDLHAARAMHTQGNIAARRGDAGAAAGRYRAALAVFETHGSRRDIVRCYGALGDLSEDQDDLRAAETYRREALTIASGIGDLVGQATALAGLARINQRRGDTTRAADYERRALALRTRIGDPRAQAGSHYHLAELASSAGDLDLAGEHLRRTEELLDLAGEPLLAARAAQQSGAAAEKRGDFREAADAYQRGVQQARTAGYPALVATLSAELAGALHRQRRFADCLIVLRDLLPLAEQLDEPRQTAVVHYQIADLEATLGHAAEAIRHAALGIRRDPGRADEVTAACVELLRRLRFAVGEVQFDRCLPDGELRATVQRFLR